MVDISEANIGFQPKHACMGKNEVKERHIVIDVARDNDRGVFWAWDQLLMESAIRCAGSYEQAEEKCLEAEIRKVSPSEASRGRANVRCRIR